MATGLAGVEQAYELPPSVEPDIDKMNAEPREPVTGWEVEKYFSRLCDRQHRHGGRREAPGPSRSRLNSRPFRPIPEVQSSSREGA